MLYKNILHMIKNSFLFVLVGLAAVFIIVNSCQASTNAFSLGEKLLYKIRWGFIPAGEVTLEVAKPESQDNDAAFHFILKAHTYAAIDLIYRYRETVESITPAGIDRSLYYKKLMDTRHPRDIIVNFDWNKNEAIYSNYGDSLPPISIEPGTLDPLASLYYIRNQPLKEDLILYRPITDGKKAVIGNIKVLKKETLEINGNTYETYMLEPEMKEVKGVFEKSKNAKLHLWVTTDHRKLLVKLKSEVRVGSFVAELFQEQSSSGDTKKDSLPNTTLKGADSQTATQTKNITQTSI